MTELAERLAGKFIVLDGPDGSGKSTQLKLLADYLRSRSAPVAEARDPGGTVIGDQIRHILLDHANARMAIACEILLYMASRVQLAEEVIVPAIDEGTCVLCDRWVSSTIAYQVAEGTATAEGIMEMYDMVLGELAPDLTIIVDIEAEIGLARAGDAGEHDRMEAKGRVFHDDVRRLFLCQAEADPDVVTVVDGSGSIEDVHREIVRLLKTWKFS